jgi:hypothetical protein
MNDPATRPAARPPLRPDMTVRQVALDYPACREVLRRHGEPEDRPTKFGHLEPLAHFARRQGIDLGQLLAELAGAAGVGVDRQGARAELVHRPFIASALAITLSLGAGWGALLLFEIGWYGNFEAAPAGHVVAHGAAQLWGFVGLFVVGIALRYLPMAGGGPRADLAFSRLLLAAFLVGVIDGFVWALAPAEVGWLGPLSGAALVLAAALFLAFLLRQVGAKLRQTWGRLVAAAGVWMLVWACTTLLLRSRWSAQGPGVYGEALRQLLMELAIFGFALNAIYGFGLRLLSGMVGSGTPHRGAIEATFWLHNAGVLLLALAHLTWPAAAVPAGVAALAAAAFCYALGMRGFVPVRRMSARPEVGQALLGRYVQLAFFWLLAGLVLLLFAALFWDARGLAPPHAYLGAVRHALTVGFMTTLLLGVGQRLLPILGHTLLPWPRLVLPTLLLIAVGNLLRVLTELATPVSPAAFTVMPISALLELSALTLFTANALRTLWPAPDPLLWTGRVTPSTSVAVLLAVYPWLEDHLFAWGLGYVGRVRSVPRELTLGTWPRARGKLRRRSSPAPMNCWRSMPPRARGKLRRRSSPAPGRVKLDAFEQGGNDSHPSAPGGVGTVDRDQHLQPLLLPAGVLPVVEQVRRLARAVQQQEPAVLAPPCQECPDHRPQRRQAEAAGHDQHVLAAGLLQRPARAVGATQPEDVAGPQPFQDPGDHAGKADRVPDSSPAALETEMATSPSPKTSSMLN